MVIIRNISSTSKSLLYMREPEFSLSSQPQLCAGTWRRQLMRFCVENNWGSLVAAHNAGGDFHLDLYVIGYDIQAAHDIVSINISSLHFLLNVFRAINAGRSMQLSGDCTFNFCRHNVDMIGFGVNSICDHNHPLSAGRSFRRPAKAS
jgi:hypothetical protein